jgi:hypothetical protein
MWGLSDNESFKWSELSNRDHFWEEIANILISQVGSLLLLRWIFTFAGGNSPTK